MNKAFEQNHGLLPTDASAEKVLQSGDRALNRPAVLGAAQRAAVVGDALRPEIRAVRRDPLDALVGKFGVQGIVVVGLVTDDPFGPLAWQHEPEALLHEPALVDVRWGEIDRRGQTADIDQEQYFHAFSDLGAAQPVAAGVALAERGVDETLVKLVAAALFDQPAGALEDPLEDALAGPFGKPAMDGALGTEPPRQVLPLGPVVSGSRRCRPGPCVCPPAGGRAWGCVVDQGFVPRANQAVQEST